MIDKSFNKYTNVTMLLDFANAKEVN
jgi:hypothetical protein